MGGAELVHEVVNLVEDPNLVIIDSIVLDCFMYILDLQTVDNLDTLEVDSYSSSGTARDICHFIGLNSNLNTVPSVDEGNKHMVAWLGDAVEQRSSTPIDTNMTVAK
jgi:hypothetical protein